MIKNDKKKLAKYIQKGISQSLKNKVILLAVISCVISILAIVKYSFTSPYSPDTWTHIGLGRHIVSLKKIPTHFTVSFKEDVSLSLEWVTHSWLSDVLFYLASSTGSIFSGIFILLPILFLNIFLLYGISKSLKINKTILFSILPLPILISVSFWKVHPLLYTTPLLLLMLYTYLLWRNGSAKSLLVIPLVFLFFSNMSGGYIFIPAAFFLFIFLNELVFFLLKRHIPSIKSFHVSLLFLFITFVSSLATIILNPYALRLFIYPLTFFGLLERKSWFSSLSGSLLITNQNFLRNPTSSFIESVYAIYFVFTSGILFFLFIKNRKFFIRYYYLLPLLLFFLLPLFWIRFIPLAVFLTFPIFLVFMHELYSRLKKPALPILLALICVLLGVFLLIKPVRIAFTEPKQQIELIKSLNLPLNLFTSQDISGYTLYSLFPAKMNLDAQDDIFDDNELITTFSPTSSSLPNTPSAINTILDENNIGTILVNRNVGDLAYLFNQINDWALIYFDENGFLFTKKEFIETQVLKEHEIKYLDLSRNLGFSPENATNSAKELERFVKKYPKNYMAQGQLASTYRYLEELDLAEKTLKNIPEDKWTYITKTEMGRLRAAQGYCKSAEYYLLDALRDRNERNFSRAVLDLAVLYATCLNNPQKAKHYMSRYYSYQLSPLEREKAKQISDDFNIPLEE